MKYWKRMKTSTKIGLATTAVYSATALALPAFAAVKEQPKEVPVEVINLENVKTATGADALFYTKLEEYSSDKKLNSGEIKNLNSILVKEKKLLDEKGSEIEEYVKITGLNEKKEQLEKKLESLTQGRYGVLANLDFDLSERRKKIESLLEKECPGILNNDNTKLSVTYPATMEIDQKDLRKLIDDTADAIKKLLDEADYEDELLNSITKKCDCDLDLQDVVKLFTIMEDYGKVLEAKKYVEKELTDLRLEEKKILESKGLENLDLKFFLDSGQEVSKTLKAFSEYIAFEDAAKEFIEKFEDINKYWSFSKLGYSRLRNKDSEAWKRLNPILKKSREKLIENRLNEYLKSQSLDAKVVCLKNPRSLKLPNAWFLIFTTFIAPITRNLLIRRYMGAKGDSDYSKSFWAGFGNGLLGIIITDGLAPWAFYARMATPLAIQPLKRWMRGNSR